MVNYTLHKSPFERRPETINLVLPVFFLLAALFEIFQRPSFSRIQILSLNVLSEFIFLNSLHVIFTVLFFINRDEFKNYVRSKSEELGYPLVFKWALAYLAFLAAACILFFNHSFSFAEISLASFLTKIALIYRVHHSVSQNVGMSLLYYSDVQNLDRPEPFLKKCISFERLFWPIILGLTLLSHLAMMYLELRLQVLMFCLNVLIVFFMVLYLYTYTRKLDKGFSNLRLIFNLRYLLYPLAFSSRLAGIGICAIHGVEYYLINQKISPKEPNGIFKNVGFGFYFFSIAFSVSSFITILYFVSDHSIQKNYFLPFFICYVFFQSVSFFHFYVDGHIFKFKDASVQRFIGPLFFRSDLRKSVKPISSLRIE